MKTIMESRSGLREGTPGICLQVRLGVLAASSFHPKSLASSAEYTDKTYHEDVLQLRQLY